LEARSTAWSSRYRFRAPAYLAINDREPLDDERVRKALAHGLDRARLARHALDQPAQGGFIPPSLPGHSHDLAPAYDLDRARALLVEAGYPDGRGLPELRLLHVTVGSPGQPYRQEREAGWQQWHELGIRLRHEWLEWVDGRDSPRVAESDLFEWAWSTDYPDPDGMLGSALDGWPIVRDAETERLITRARSLRSRDERLALFRKADHRLVAEHVWLVPTSYHFSYLAHRPWLEGVWTSPIAISPLSDVVVRSGSRSGAC